MSQRTRTILGRAFLALSAISLVVGIATHAWDTVPLAVVGLTGGLLLLNVRSDAAPVEAWRHLALPLIVGSLALVVAMIVYRTAAAPFVLPALIVLMGAAIALFQLRRA
ncbi:MAG: hypothetical protein WEE64_07515 [Dehalococcoidia bacterium]